MPVGPYAARLTIDYPERLDRVTTFFRLIWVIPIAIVLGVITGSGTHMMVTAAGEQIVGAGGGLLAGLAFATALMIVIRMRYPRWWFDFARELTRFGARVGAYVALLTDRYPSTVEEQSVHLEIEYPEVDRDLNRWLPLVKWFLAIPHYVALIVLIIGAALAIVIAWFAILMTGRYPQPLFNYVVGVGRWSLRVNAYAFLLVTDRRGASLLAMLTTPFFVLLHTPKIRPFSWSRLCFTYLLPVVPLIVMIDGVVSCLRSYTTGELAELTGSLTGAPYDWEIRQLDSPKSPFPIIYAIGCPITNHNHR